MDINKTWGIMNFDDFELPKRVNEIKSFSQVPLQKIKNHIFYNLVFGFLIVVIYPVLIFIVDDIVLSIGFGVLLVYSMVLIYQTFRLYQIINPNISPDHSILAELSYQHDMIQQWISIQQKTGLLFYPVSISVGFLMGGMAGSGLGLVEFLQAPHIVMSLILAMLLLTPLCYFSVKWMLKYSFGKDMLALSQLIKEIQEGV